MSTLEGLKNRVEAAKPNIVNYLASVTLWQGSRELHLRYDELLSSCELGIQQLEDGTFEVTDASLKRLETFVTALERGTQSH